MSGKEGTRRHGYGTTAKPRPFHQQSSQHIQTGTLMHEPPHANDAIVDPTLTEEQWRAFLSWFYPTETPPE
jgi:hypothetical protein